MNDTPFKPFMQVSRSRLEARRNVLVDGSGDLFWQLLFEMDETYTVEIFKKDLMAAAGIKHADTFRLRLAPLQDAGLVTYTDNAPNGKMRFEINPHYIKYLVPSKIESESKIDGVHSSYSSSSDLSPEINSIPEEETTTTTTMQERSPEEIATDPRNAFEMYGDEIGELTQLAGQRLGDLIDTYGEGQVKAAIAAAVMQNVRKLSYIVGTLKRMAEPSRPAGQWENVYS